MNQRKVHEQTWMGVLGLVLTPVAVAVGDALIFVIVLFYSRKTSGDADPRKCAWIAAASIPVLFLVNLLIPDAGKDDSLSDGPDGSFTGHYVCRHKLQFAIVLWILFTGPRVFTWAVSSFRKASRWRRQDAHSCAAVLWLLLIKGKRVPYGEFPVELDWLDLESVSGCSALAKSLDEASDLIRSINPVPCHFGSLI